MEFTVSKAPTRLGVFFSALFRILVLTVVFAALGMALGLFFGIIGAIITAAIGHNHADMSIAYRNFAIPLAVTFGAGAFLYNLVTSIRRAVRHA